MAVQNNLSLPPHTSVLRHQLAGHIHGEGTRKFGVLKHEDGHILKPLAPVKSQAERELSFYECVSAAAPDDFVFHKLSSFIPKFYGTWTGTVNGSRVRYMCLEDVADSFKIPCNLDVKVGGITYDPFASVEKKDYEISKYPIAKEIGFRILGMRVFDEAALEYMMLGKDFGKKQTAETLLEALHMYLNRDTSFLSVLILSGFLHYLKAIESWFSVQRRLAFYASSLLFFYEAEIGAWLACFQDLNVEAQLNDRVLENLVLFHQSIASKDTLTMPLRNRTVLKNHICWLLLKLHLCSDKNGICSVCNLNKVVCGKLQSCSWLINVRMIDFAHVLPSEDVDENYLFGLRKLIGYFQLLHEKLLNENSIC